MFRPNIDLENLLGSDSKLKSIIYIKSGTARNNMNSCEYDLLKRTVDISSTSIDFFSTVDSPNNSTIWLDPHRISIKCLLWNWAHRTDWPDFDVVIYLPGNLVDFVIKIQFNVQVHSLVWLPEKISLRFSNNLWFAPPHTHTQVKTEICISICHIWF